MSHTFFAKDGTRFHHNSDLSGDVTVVPASEKGAPSLDVSGDALVEFVANFVRQERINELEDESPYVTLGIPRRCQHKRTLRVVPAYGGLLQQWCCDCGAAQIERREFGSIQLTWLLPGQGP